MDKRILVAFSKTFLYSPLMSLSNIERSKKLQLVIHRTTHTRYSSPKWQPNEKERGKDNMVRDHSEYIDDYCRDKYGHTNWGYLDTYTKEELKNAKNDIENNIVFWYNEMKDE